MHYANTQKIWIFVYIRCWTYYSQTKWYDDDDSINAWSQCMHACVRVMSDCVGHRAFVKQIIPIIQSSDIIWFSKQLWNHFVLNLFSNSWLSESYQWKWVFGILRRMWHVAHRSMRVRFLSLSGISVIIVMMSMANKFIECRMLFVDFHTFPSSPERQCLIHLWQILLIDWFRHQCQIESI